jgi:hypothetical protein
MKLKVLGASALTLALALAGAPAASARTAVLPVSTFYLFTYENGTPLCVSDDVVHTQEVFLTSHYPGDCMPMELIYPYTTPNGNTWFEMQMVGNSNCLNYIGQANGALVESDSCQKNDYYELWYNKYQRNSNTAFENLEGNVGNGAETYLAPIWNTTIKTWDVYASTAPISGYRWYEMNT